MGLQETQESQLMYAEEDWNVFCDEEAIPMDLFCTFMSKVSFPVSASIILLAWFTFFLLAKVIFLEGTLYLTCIKFSLELLLLMMMNYKTRR